MNNNYSLYKIFKNRIGGFIIILAVIAIITFPVALFLVNNLSTKISLLLYSGVFILGFIPYLLITMGKINYFFKHGIETKALVVDDTYMPPPRYISVFLLNKVLSPGNDIDNYKRDGVVYTYKMGSEIYENRYRFIINGDTMSIKQNSVVTILVDPKNKNNSIIRDIYR
jgi:hypothetical protein